ncbi:MAG: DNA mismatch repair endonuclease MutL [Elusimicrobiota bacterium]
MDKIRLLPQEIVNKIAAGEVVERPASVVKELVENSIDAGMNAGSTYINIEIEDAGKKLIRISDNGCGMSKNDALLALERHATSKISNFNDLAKLQTLGFRGEALPSIAGVSKFKLTTKEKESLTGLELVIEGGKVISSKECGRNDGTTIEVTDLFFNIPARKKFMKSSSVEQAHIVRTLEEIALAHPNIGFSVKIDSKLLFVTPPSNKIENRISDILGNKFFSGLINREDDYKYIKINAFISNIDSSYSNKNTQYFFVNKRTVANKLLSQALYSAFKDSLPVGRHPMAIIMIEVNPEYVDVNVHPAKMLVKFSDEHEIFEAVNQTVRKALTSQASPSLSVKEIKTVTPEKSMFNIENSQQTILSHTYQAQNNQSKVSDNQTLYNPAEQKTTLFNEFHILGQLHDTYALIETSQGLVIMDQHAANERVLYERFLKQNSDTSFVPSQKLLIPFTLELMPHEISILKNFIEEINKLGFEISEFGKNTLIFKSIPALFGEISQLKDFLKDFINLLLDDYSDKNLLTLKPLEKIIRASCRAAVKAREKISFQETEKIILELKNCAQPLCCPHGRPTMINITVPELEKKFRRL